MRRFKNAFDTAGAQVALVAMAPPEKIRAFKSKLELPFVMISDPRRDLYQAFDIGFMSFARTFSPAMAIKVAVALSKGYGIGIPYGDIRQLPAVFIIDTDGFITFCHYGDDAAGHPQTANIIEFLTR